MTNKVTGHVSYDVEVDCPHCNKRLTLNQHPYDDEESPYFQEDDPLGLAVFGTVTEPATWDNLNIEYTCCCCHTQFLLSKLET